MSRRCWVLVDSLQRYREKFGEAFPLMCCMGMSDDEVISVIDECVRSGNMFEPIDGADY